jgi:RNA polymerase sigma-70 factor (ECF subfamily)
MQSKTQEGTASTERRAEGGPPSDEELMLRYRSQNDEVAATELIGRYSSRLRSYLRRLVGESSADDLVQATLLKVHQHRDSYEPGHPVHTWIYSIATHAAIDWLRRASRTRTISLEGPQGDGHDDRSHSLVDFLRGHHLASAAAAEVDESREHVRQAIGRLPPHLRAATNLVDMQGLSYADASRVLRIPVGTAKSRVHHARERLRHDLEQQSTAELQAD